jgi:hypothetical protein
VIGHNWRRANLLLAVAQMVRENAFPKSWNVRSEDFPALPLY